MGFFKQRWLLTTYNHVLRLLGQILPSIRDRIHLIFLWQERLPKVQHDVFSHTRQGDWIGSPIRNLVGLVE